MVVGERVRSEAKQMFADFSRLLAESQQDARPALLVTTSGSTGKPKQTVLSSGALKASASATAQATDSKNAQWLLALPLHYVAGAQVVARSAIAGIAPVVAPSISQKASFTARDFVESTNNLTAPKTMTSLVPTQLHTLLEAEGALRDEAVSALQSYTAILVGGAPASQKLLGACTELNINTVTTYGSAETAGGCVYNHRPLPGVLVATDEHQRIWLGGPTLASGYLNEPKKTATSFFTASDGTSWYRTDDLGSFNVASNHLSVQGRNDDVIISGGVKVSAGQVAQALEAHPAIREVFVTGVSHERWGQSVAVALTCVPGTQTGRQAGTRPAPTLEELKELTRPLGQAATPARLLVLDEFPTLSTGKPDRRALAQLLTEHISSSNMSSTQ